MVVAFPNKTQEGHLPVAIRVNEIQQVALIGVQAFLKLTTICVLKSFRYFHVHVLSFVKVAI
jgi:hypothetical protein